jgi:hypothetical protein
MKLLFENIYIFSKFINFVILNSKNISKVTYNVNKKLKWKWEREREAYY